MIYEDRTLFRLATVSAQAGGREALMGSIDPTELTELIEGA